MRWFLGLQYLAVTALTLVALGPWGRARLEDSLFSGVVPCDPSSILAAPAWALILMGLVYRQSWATLLSVLSFPAVFFATSQLGIDPASPAPFGADPLGWTVIGRVPMQILLEPLAGKAGMSSLLVAPLSWAAYGLHLALLAPLALLDLRSLHASMMARSRIRERKRTLTLDSKTLSLYRSNPYQVLGLLPSAASTRAIVQRRDEIETLLDADMALEDNLDGFWRVGGGDAFRFDASDSNHASAQLQSETSRLEALLLWFHLDDEDSGVLDALRTGETAALENAWSERWQAKAAPTFQRHRALHNLAVLTHARVLEQERTSSVHGRFKNGDAWKAALALWKDAVHHSAGVEYLELRSAHASDPRVDDAFVQRLARSQGRRVLAVNIELARSAASQGFTKYANAQLHLVRSSGFPEADVNVAIRSFFSGDVERVRERLRPLRAQTGELCADEELKSLAAEYPGLRARFAPIGGKELLVPLVDEALENALRRVRKALTAKSNTFFGEDERYFKLVAAVIRVWNAYMAEFNARGFSHSAQQGLKETYRQLLSHKSGLKNVEQVLAGLERSVKATGEVVELLRGLAEDASEETRSDYSKLVSELSKVMPKAQTEYGKTKEQLERNLAGMASNLN